jgi:hypothetical protein
MMKKNQQVNIKGYFSACEKLRLFFYLVDLFQAGKFSKDFQVKPPGELDQVQTALEKLLFMLKHLITYVDEIIVRIFVFFTSTNFFFDIVESKTIGSKNWSYVDEFNKYSTTS